MEEEDRHGEDRRRLARRNVRTALLLAALALLVYIGFMLKTLLD